MAFDLLDTNVIVYAFDKREPVKAEIATAILALGPDGPYRVCSQVIQESLTVLRKRMNVPFEVREQYARRVLTPICVISTTPDLLLDAHDLAEETQYSLYDSLVLASAIRSGARRLLTEDMQPGRFVRGVEIADPFR